MSINQDLERELEARVRRGSSSSAFGVDLEKRVETRLWQERHEGEILNNLKRFVPNLVEATVVEIGSGHGGKIVRLQQQEINVIGIEFNSDNCHISRLRGMRYGLPNVVVNGAAEALPIKDKVADVVLAYEVLEHVFHPIKMLREIRRILRPGGIALITVHNRWTLLDHHFGIWGISYMPRKMADALLRRLGKGPFGRASGVQSLSEMHYYSWSAFGEICDELGFSVSDVREKKLASQDGSRVGPRPLRPVLRLLRSLGVLSTVYRLYRRTVMGTYHVILTNTTNS